MSRSAADITGEFGPFPGVENVHGVSYDGEKVWFAAGDKLKAFDPANGKILWHARLGTVSNAPETFMLDGHQYILLAAGDTLYTFTLY